MSNNNFRHNNSSGQFNNRNFNNNRNYNNNTSGQFINKNYKKNFESNETNSISETHIELEVKKQVINYIYQSVNLSKYKYKILEFESDLPLLKETKYFVSANYNGIHSLLVFIKLQNKFYSFIIDRKTMFYKVDQIDFNKVKFITANIRLDDTIYNGTIFDGVLLYNNNHRQNNYQNKIFIINDAYYFRGANLINEKINFKMINLSSYIDTYYKADNYMNNISVMINKVYEMSETKKLINVYTTNSKFSTNIKGIAFYPEISGTKLIYLYNNNTVITEEGDTKSAAPEMSPIVKTVKPTINTDNLEFVFKMKNTDIVDVYNLYLAEYFTQNNKSYVKCKKFCIAYIPTNECSEFCKNLFKNDEDVYVECKYIPDKDKWIPLKQVFDKKRLDQLAIVEQKIGKKIDN